MLYIYIAVQAGKCTSDKHNLSIYIKCTLVSQKWDEGSGGSNWKEPICSFAAILHAPRHIHTNTIYEYTRVYKMHFKHPSM